jgi:hypothetical protein
VKGRHGINTLVITFNQALDPASAISSANYQVSIPGSAAVIRHGHRTAARPARSLAVTKVAYDLATKEVTLTLRKKLTQGQAIALQITGTPGGVVGTQGTALNSPGTLKPGSDYTTSLKVTARHS